VGGPSRDPRAPWALSVVYRALVRHEAFGAAPGKRLEALRWWPVDEVREAARPAFDHAALAEDAAAALRAELDQLEIPFRFAPDAFTLGELQSLCEALMGRRLDKSSFRRRLDERALVEPVTGEWRTGAFRPAQLYRARRHAQ
jgi:ADP-ribose pyrophosphatase YjhB (NUDIX family)